MPIVEIRRHAERALVSGPPALSPAGRAMAEALGAELTRANGPFALVVSSPLNRAKETATLVGGRLDAVDPALLPDVGGANIFGELATLASWAKVLERQDALTFAKEQVRAWTAIAGRVGAKDRALAISHSGIIHLPAMHP